MLQGYVFSCEIIAVIARVLEIKIIMYWLFLCGKKMAVFVDELIEEYQLGDFIDDIDQISWNVSEIRMLIFYFKEIIIIGILLLSSIVKIIISLWFLFQLF